MWSCSEFCKHVLHFRNVLRGYLVSQYGSKCRGDAHGTAGLASIANGSLCFSLPLLLCRVCRSNWIVSGAGDMKVGMWSSSELFNFYCTSVISSAIFSASQHGCGPAGPLVEGAHGPGGISSLANGFLSLFSCPYYSAELFAI